MIDRRGNLHANSLAEPEADWRDVMPALAALAVGLICLVLGTLLTKTIPGQYLVVTPLDAGRVEMLELVYAANGGVVGFGGLPNIAIATSVDPGFKQAALAGGALFVMPSPRLLGCITLGDGVGP